MTMDTHHVVSLVVATDDSALVDDLVAELPADDGPATGPEYDGPDRGVPEDAADGVERLAARVTYVVDTVDVDGTTYDGPAEAADLYARLTGYDLPAGAVVRHYLSPCGGVTTKEVRAWYEANPDAQPVDQDGEPYVPTSWDPSLHMIDEIAP